MREGDVEQTNNLFKKKKKLGLVGSVSQRGE